MRIEVLTEPAPADAASLPANEIRELAPRELDPGLLARWGAWLERLGGGPAVAAQLEALRSGAACVVTGQQAGVLTGPLLTILKAARAVSLARELAAHRGRPVVPVFWIAGDDHDLDEIHHTYVVGASGQLVKLRLELGDARGAAGETLVPADAGRLLEELWDAGGIDRGALAPERFAPRAGDTLSTWFARCLLELFGEHGLVPFEPALLGEAARPVFARALRDGEVARALQAGADALKARGIPPPLPVDADPPVFWIEPGSRTRVRRRGGPSGELVAGDRALATAELLEHCGPGLPRLSGNVALRTILQAACLPALAYVAGPSEIVYYEQLRPLHALFDVPFPALVPRPLATVFSTAAARGLRKLGRSPREIFAALAVPSAPAKSAAAKPPILARGEVLRAEVARYVDELLAASPAVKSAASRRATQLLQSFDGVLERAAESFARGDEVAAARWAALETLLRPRGRPQDRSLNVLPLLAEHGPALIDAFLQLRGEPGAGGVVQHSLVLPD